MNIECPRCVEDRVAPLVSPRTDRSSWCAKCREDEREGVAALKASLPVDAPVFQELNPHMKGILFD